MNLFRNNLYLVILIVVTLVVTGGFLYQGSNKATQIEETQVLPRQKISRSLAQLSRPPRANAGTIEGKDARNKAAKRELNEVTTSLTKYNRRNFKVGSLTLLNGKPRSVLPYASDVWRDNVLAQPYIQSYHDSLDGLLEKLHATTIPTDRVVEREATNLQSRFDREDRARMGETISVRKAKTGKGRSATTNISSLAWQQAANKAKLINARDGQLYATKDCFDIRLTDMNQSQLTADEVWESQLNMWVQQDIVDVLVKTNEEVQKSLKIPENERCVINSAVKRLEKIEISGQGGEASKSKKTSKRRGASMMGPGMMGPGMMGPGMMGPGMMGPGMMGPGGGTGRSQRGRKTRERKVESADSLTGNTADKMMDVVDYSFTVIISTRYLPVLEKKLIEQNFHFILNESIENYPSVASVPDSSDGNYSEEQLSYYGVDPVSRVTITGQLALLTDWVRGTYDREEKVWLTPPLMPISVMEKLPPAAQRRQDNDLISKKLPRPWDPSFVPPKSRESLRKKSRRSSRGRRR